MQPLVGLVVLAAVSAAGQHQCQSPPVDVPALLRQAPRPATSTFNGVTVFDWQRRAELGPGGLNRTVEAVARNSSASWVVLAPIYIADNVSDPVVRADEAWTMAGAALVGAVARAHQLGLKVMLKPHIQLRCMYGNGSVPGAGCHDTCQDWLRTDTQPCYRDNLGCNLGGAFGPPWGPAQWRRFFSNASWGGIIRELGSTVVRPHSVEAFCLSTELSCATTAPGTAPYWRELLRLTRAAAPAAKLTVAMHDKDLMRDDGTSVGFLDAAELDWLGFDAYHGFSTLPDVPNVTQVAEAWASRGQQRTIHHVPMPCWSPFEWYKNVSETYRKPIVFTEWGFTGAPGCATSSLGRGLPPRPPSRPQPRGAAPAGAGERCQADAFAGTMELFRRASWWAGSFWWDWVGEEGVPPASSFAADGRLLLQAAMRSMWAEPAASTAAAAAAASVTSCVFSAGGYTYNLSHWRDRTIVARGPGGTHYNLSVCGDLAQRCIDSEVHVPMPPGCIYSMYKGEVVGTCWDVLAHWADLQQPTLLETGSAAAPPLGLALRFSHFGDAHIDCGQNITAVLRLQCDPLAVAGPVATGAQGLGCEWDFEVKTADPAVCRPRPRLG